MFFLILCIFLFFLFFYLKFINKSENKLTKEILKFQMLILLNQNSQLIMNSKKIFVTAKEGNLLDENKILLRKNVKFSSDNFTIETDQCNF